ncbi:C40 family peptidase [bacterium]|nr:C40 family peptidase [bacterium]
MKTGYCHLTQIPLRKNPSSTEEMVTQMIYGETYDILEDNEEWSKVRMHFDGYEGWISHSSLNTEVHHGEFIQKELFNIYMLNNSSLIASMGSEFSSDQADQFSEPTEGNVRDLAMKFIGVPYMWGGRTFAGVDCSGFVQIVYKCLGVSLPRDAWQQQELGKPVSFDLIREGDLVFFEKDARVTHVGIALRGGKIIHAHGAVRIDELKKEGIYNEEKQSFSHQYHSAKRL